MSAAPAVSPAQAPGRRAPSSRLWVWGAILSSLLVCAMVTWLHFQQRQALRQARIEVESIRQARVDLAQGFLHLSLAGDSGSPFGREQGLALLGQALESFAWTLGSSGPVDPVVSASFRRTGEAFQARLTEWRSDVGGRQGSAARLRIAYAQLELEAARVDAWHQHQLRTLSARLDTQFALALAGAVLLLGGLCAMVLFSTRARDRSASVSKENEDLFRMIFEMTSAGYALTSPEGVFLMVNQAFAAMLGYRVEDLTGLHFSKVTYPEDAGPSLGILHEALSSDSGARPFEKRYLHRDGRTVWASVRTALRRDERGDPMYFIANIQDITERMQAEQALRESENRLRFALEATNDGLWDVQMGTGMTYLSPRGCQMLGYGPDELAEGLTLWKDLVHPDDLSRGEERLRAHLDGRAPVFEAEQRLRTRDGAWTWVLARGKVVARDAAGTPLRMIGTHTDLTVQKRLEEQLLQSQKLEAIGRLAGGVAHDFNNMLMVILGYSETALLQVQDNPALMKSLVEIRKAAERSANLTQQLLAFARQQPISPKVLDLNEAVEGALRMLGRLIGENIQLEWRPGPGLDRVLIDPAQVDQILANLCVNARDAIGGSGRITLETSNAQYEEAGPEEAAEPPPGACVVLSVTDNGSGIDKATLAKVFEPFFTTKAAGKGTGLGLATVYGIVKQNQGAIRVYSEPGMGSTFRIYLPRHLGLAEAREAPVQEAPRGRGELVLLTDDEPVIREVARDMLELLGYRVLEAASPEDAIRLAQGHPEAIHLLMTDFVMPGMNGHELARQVRALRPGVACLFMSGYAANVVMHDGRADDGTPFVQKPFSMNDLGIKIQVALGSGPGVLSRSPGPRA